MSSLKAAMKGHQKTHRERGQLAGRKHLGHLEKHKDYVKRARHFHKKENIIKKAKEKARDKNPDEFYFNMVSTKVENGVHKLTNKKSSPEELFLMKSQDTKYLTYKKNAEAKKIEKLQKGLHMIDASDQAQRQHTFFVDSDRDVATFDAAKQLNTVPELLNRTHNRTTLEQLKTSELFPKLNRKREQVLQKANLSAYKELSSRIKREQKLARTRDTMVVKNRLAQMQGKKEQNAKKVFNESSGKIAYKFTRKRTK